MKKRDLEKLAEQARRAGIAGVSKDADGNTVVHMSAEARDKHRGGEMAKLTDRHEQMIDAVLDGARTILEEHIVAIERGFANVVGEEAARVAISATWKQVKDEGIVLEIAGKATIPVTRTTRSVQLLGGQLSLFGAPEESAAAH